MAVDKFQTKRCVRADASGSMGDFTERRPNQETVHFKAFVEKTDWDFSECNHKYDTSIQKSLYDRLCHIAVYYPDIDLMIHFVVHSWTRSQLPGSPCRPCLRPDASSASESARSCCSPWREKTSRPASHWTASCAMILSQWCRLLSPCFCASRLLSVCTFN